MVDFKIDIKVRRHWRYHIAHFFLPVALRIPGLRWLALKTLYSGVSYQVRGMKRKRLRWADRGGCNPLAHLDAVTTGDPGVRPS